VDLALLDTLGRGFGQPVRFFTGPSPEHFPYYSAVSSADQGIKAIWSLLKIRLYGFREVKLKIESGHELELVRLARQVLGKDFGIRVDANMAWNVPQALENMPRMARYGVHSFEQPLAAQDVSGLARLVRETGLGVMADESLSDGDSLENLIALNACTAANVRISKCGGLTAAFRRCQRALRAGLEIQIGCQVGETSLLSAAQLILVAAVQKVRYAEGCFGLHLLREDPVAPLMQFGYGGRPPKLPEGPGLGVGVDERLLDRWSVQKFRVAKGA
jgi:muconate cycloisomerase